MHPNLVLCIFATAFVLIQCEFKYTACSPVEDDKPHHFRVEDCNHKKFMDLLLNDDFGYRYKRAITNAMEMNNSTKEPRPMDVRLIPEPGYEFFPPTVLARRCAGHCECGFSPHPINRTQKLHAVRMRRKGNPPGDLNCVFVEVEEHTECECTCSNSEKKTLPPIIVVFYILGMLRYLIPCKDCQQMDRPKPHKIHIHDCKDVKFESSIDDDVTGNFPALRPLEKWAKIAGNYEYHPSMVIVRRCNGPCDKEFTLQAVETKNRTFLAIQSGVGELSKCVNVTVEEHTECACTCIKKETDCNKPRQLDKETCTCECPDEYGDDDCEDQYSGIKY